MCVRERERDADRDRQREAQAHGGDRVWRHKFPNTHLHMGVSGIPVLCVVTPMADG